MVKGWGQLEERKYIFYAFHGTPESCAIGIIESNRFETGRLRADHWLGQGIYFFKDDDEQAYLWASNKVKRCPEFNGQEPRVIEVLIETSECYFLNLDTRAGLDYLESFLNLFKKEKALIVPKDPIEIIKIRCYLLSLLPRDIWIIQRTFSVKSKFDESLLGLGLSLVGTQVCVRNHDVIKAIKLLKNDRRSKKTRITEGIKLEKGDMSEWLKNR